MNHTSTPAKDTLNCSIPQACQRVVPRWVVVLDNIPTVLMCLIGATLIDPLGRVFAIGYLIYCGLSVLLFWYLICPCCHHFGTRACPCGYGMVAARLFRQAHGKDFTRVFKRNIGVVFPCWFIPFGIGLYVLWMQFRWLLFAKFVIFCIIGFVVIPAISIWVGCRGCGVRDECPWMSFGHQKNTPSSDGCR